MLDFCARVKAAGYQPAVYSNYNWLYGAKYLDADRIRAAGIPVWMAWYSKATPADTDRSGLCDIWQYASDGRVDGISGNVDCNVSYRDFGTAAWSCDTSGTVEVARGKAYQALITCKGRPQVVAGSPDIATVLHRYDDGDRHYYYFVPIGRPGDAAGVYINGGPRQFVIKIK